MSLDAFSSTIERLYAAAADPSKWASALDAIENLTGAAGAVLCFVPQHPKEREPFVLAGRFTPEQCEEYARDHMPTCPRIALATRRPDLALHYDALLGSDAELDRDPTYDWFEMRSGVRYYLGTPLPSVGGYDVNTSIQRTRRQGHVQQDDIDLYERLRPHLVQAVQMSNLIGTLGAERETSLGVLERLSHGVLILDRDASLLFANQPAEAILLEDDGLHVARGRLGASRAAETRSLRRLVGAAATHDDRHGGWLRVPRPSGRRDYAVFVAPLAETDVALVKRQRVFVVIIDLDGRTPADISALEALFGLSAKQAEMAALLAAGHELTETARRLGITSDTARSHLKSIFRKLGVNRQQDMASVLARLGTLRK